MEESLGDQVNELCARFEHEWRLGNQPAIGVYLEGRADPLRSELLRELLTIDVQYRRKFSLGVSASDYAGLLPSDDLMLHSVLDANANDSGPAASFSLILQLCATFRRQLTLDDEPDIERYLNDAPPNVRLPLFRNLMSLEIVERRKRGQQPTAEDYIARFPQLADVVRQAFVASTTHSSGSWQETTHNLPVTIAAIPKAALLGDYRLVRELGRGGMGVVFEAQHISRGNRVALKTLPSSDGAALHRFKREFRSLADVNHPNLITLQSLEADGGQWFLTMDLIDGTDFLSYVRPLGSLDEGRLRSALSQLVAGVLALHKRPIIHRDLKPSNVLVSREGRLIVLDFGLVTEQEADRSTRSAASIAGTPAYMAPEQAAAGVVTGLADWYAVGVMVYEALTGERPFHGSSVNVMRAKQHSEPPPLCVSDCLQDLASLALRLLARDPNRRPSPIDIAGIVAQQEALTPAAPLAGQTFVGRVEHLAALRGAFQLFDKQRQPLVQFITGRSGEGKSTLIEHFLAPLRAEKQVAIMAGRCYDRESVPFKALDALIDALCSFLRSLPANEAAYLMPDDLGALVRVFPALTRADVVAKATLQSTSGWDEQQVRLRAFGALRSLLARLGRRWPIVWFIDDLQWGDADSAAALFQVLRPPEAPPVLLLAAYRSDEAEDSDFLKAWRSLHEQHQVDLAANEIKLGPLNATECIELVMRLLARDDEQTRQRAEEFAAETRGNPFLLIELVGCFDPETNSFQALPLHEVLDRKLARLPEEAKPLLEIIAISGQALPVEDAWRTAGQNVAPMVTLTRMRNERLIRILGHDEHPLVDTYHDRIRETVLGELDDPGRAALHARLAEFIERSVGGLSADQEAELHEADYEKHSPSIPRVFDLAYHFDAARNRPKAWKYGLLAAEQARRQFSLAVAETHYATAARNAAEVSNAVRYRIAEGRSQTLLLLGRYAEATRHVQGAMDLVDDEADKARIDELQGMIAFKQALIHESIASFVLGLRRLGIRVPQGGVELTVGLVREVTVQCAHTLLPAMRHRKPANKKRELMARLSSYLAQPYIFSRSPFHLVWSNLHGMNSCEKSPPSPTLATMYSYHACVLAMLGWPSRSARYGERASSLVTQFNDLLAIGQSSTYQGIGLYASARFDEGLKRLTEAVDAFDKIGALWDNHIARFHRGCCCFGLGDLKAAVDEARHVFASSARVGDTRTMCSSWLWARATRGNFPYEELQSCHACRPDDIMSNVHRLLAEGQWHLFHKRTDKAVHVLEEAAAMLRRTLCINSHTILVMPMLASALRQHAEALKSKSDQSSEHFRSRAFRLAKWSARITRLFPAAYPLAMREWSLALASCGRPEQALQAAEKSCAIAQQQTARYEHAQSLLLAGELRRQRGLSNADKLIGEAQAAIDEMERPLRAAARAPLM